MMFKYYANPQSEIYKILSRRVRIIHRSGCIYWCTLTLFCFKGEYTIQNVFIYSISNIVKSNDYEEPLFFDLNNGAFGFQNAGDTDVGNIMKEIEKIVNAYHKLQLNSIKEAFMLIKPTF